MDDHSLSPTRRTYHAVQNIPQKTMDPKFIVVLFCVEAGALVFNAIHVKAPEIHIYNSYNQKPIIFNQSSAQIYSCFLTINYCVYEHKQLRFLKVIHVIFISIIVTCYCGLFTIILRKGANVRVQNDLGITWYGALQLVVLLTLALHTLLMVIIHERDYANVKNCNEDSRLIRAENLFTYVVLSMLEIAYIGFDILNRQVTIHALHQNFEHRARQAEHQIPSSSYNLRRKTNLSPAESFVTVDEEFISELM
ncbi:unnamed protein product [Rotaria socialis]|uniref:Uncharacterized protein n=1 Tax=Rotaria socialis TaxID=392032 RepID=A0A820SDU9_9BILA|nr:unnamed protein product [Rotaria socialis]CAF4449777.1 unnamed protein product [Rotaria socialis]